ncbi:hypothetical protein PQX77_016055 [Marasmius sp. AFHP31]|nr:hypothetical protein PQX77_016055 [Marasmius sp. AFHP31]
MHSQFWIVVFQAYSIFAAFLPRPSVKLDSATVTGTYLGRVSRFFGIPFAKPPTGDLRFRLPEPFDPYTSSFDATAMGPACPQQAIRLPVISQLPLGSVVNSVVNTVYGVVTPDSEDCLTINIVAPADATNTSSLPVVVWIFGGMIHPLPFASYGGETLTLTFNANRRFRGGNYDGGIIVERSLELGQPIIYVSMNYRLTGFGFLASKEVKEAGVGNLGLQDQREALRWIQKYIGAFGGDPTKVTIWGESAGAISVGLHMLVDGGNTKGLFRAGFMQSGSPIPVGDITNGQEYYDALVRDTGCSGSTDTLACLRKVPYSTLKAAIDASPGIFDYQSLRLAWLPRADGVFLTDAPLKLVQQGKVANIPIVSGDCDDEGTLFSFSTLNVTTNPEFRNYVESPLIATISDPELDKLVAVYPQDITQGSPYHTGILNPLTPQFKRIASIQGDAVFQAPRRFFLEHLSGKQNIWSFLSKRFKAVPLMASFHGHDLLNIYGRGELTDCLIRFVTTLDPNGYGTPNWPKYTKESPQLLTFVDSPLIPTKITQDTYRREPMNTLIEVILAHPI